MFQEANLLKNLAKTASAFPSEAIKYRVSRRRLGWSAVHPIAEALEDECFHFAWLLRREAFLRFGYDPDAVFSEKADEDGFGK